MKHAKYYLYKTAVESEVGIRLTLFVKKCQEAEEAAKAWVKRQGAEHYYESSVGMAGGVAAVEFDHVLYKEGWDRIDIPDGGAIFVPEAGSEFVKEINALPIVAETELVPILDLQPSVTRNGMKAPFTFGDKPPVLFRHHGYWYVRVPYESQHADMQAITEKEFYRRRLAAVNES